MTLTRTVAAFDMGEVLPALQRQFRGRSRQFCELPKTKVST
jgi:hypothetical protein